jgi:NADH dehydrogenase FAD-containing subunit
MEQLPEALPTVDPELGAMVHDQLTGHCVEVLAVTTVRQVSRSGPGEHRLRVEATTPPARPWPATPT